jgi:hypothetical protein
MKHHRLTSRMDLPIYVNQEQSPKPLRSARLNQDAIDRAFQNRPRASTYVFEYLNAAIVLLNGKNTGNFGVLNTRDEGGNVVPVTSIARTLVDITVRPTYSGGVHAVLEAFRRSLSIGHEDDLVREIIEALDAVEHVYPYHQSVGFYLDHAGFSRDLLEPLRARGIHYDFYLDNQVSDAVYDQHWRITYPKALIR